ncbi:hypothetical protein FORC066_0891 [Yersinia enterocolitica]|nr:hypothetical protein FORC066_0891 [Yersinia enterocolitica]
MLNVAFFGNKTLGIITSDFHREAELLASRWQPDFYANGFFARQHINQDTNQLALK